MKNNKISLKSFSNQVCGNSLFFKLYKMGMHKNSRQEDALIEFMQNHLELARGFTRSVKIDVENLWKELVEELNSLGPPIHDLTGWKKIWTCWKAAVKKKIAINKKELVATGGGPYNKIYISKKEETVGQICGLYGFVEGIANAKSAGGDSEESSSSIEDDTNLSKTDTCRKRNREESEDLDENPGTSKRYKKTSGNIKDQLKQYIKNDMKRGEEFTESLKKFSEILEKTNENINLIGSNVRRVYKSVESLSTNLISEFKRHHEQMEKAALGKNKLKKIDLEIKQKQLELEQLKDKF